MAHHDAHVGRQGITHRFQHPAGIFQFLRKAEPEEIPGRNQRLVERRRFASNRPAARIVGLTPELPLDLVAALLGLAQVRRCSLISISH